MSETQYMALNFQPGIQRDGTDLDGNRALEALWCRWRLSRPRKIGGYESISFDLGGTPRRIHMFYDGSQTYAHVGTSQTIEQFILDRNGQVVSRTDRTPDNFVGGVDVGWSLDALFDTTSNAVQLIGHAVPDLDFLSDGRNSLPMLGKITTQDKFTYFTPPTDLQSGLYTPPKVSGGIVAVQPYLMDFDRHGKIGWSAPNNPLSLGIAGGTSGAGQARVSAQKIVQGMPLRSGGSFAPAALFWSLSEVIMAQFSGGTTVFRFNTISPSSSILSQGSVIEYDGLYFWAGIDRFLVFNGTVTEVPNQQNQDWFFDNLNTQHAAKTFAFKVPRYGEIWWCAPLFGAAEPSHALIYNVRENVWYDTELPPGGRSAGYFAQGLRYPLMGSPAHGSDGPGLWLHEKGVDRVRSGAPEPIESYFVTPYLAGPALDPPSPNQVSCEIVEPDIIQSGSMDITLSGKSNARDTDEDLESETLAANPAAPQDELVRFKKGTRMPKLKFSSNTLNGNYIFGKTVFHVKQQGARITGGPAATKGGS